MSPHPLLRRLALAASLVGLAACSSSRVPIGTVRTRWTPAAPLTQASVLLDRGQVTIRGSDDGALAVEAEVLVAEDRAAEFVGTELRFADHVAIDDGADGAVTLRSAHDGDADGDDWELRLTIRLPSEPTVRIKLDAGTVSVKLPVAGGFSADVDAGQVEGEFDELRGIAAVTVDAGQIRLLAHQRVGPIQATVDAGTIDVTLPAAFAGTLDAAAAVGDVDVAKRLGVEVEHDVASQSATGIIGAGGDARVLLRVDAGTIKVR